MKSYSSGGLYEILIRIALDLVRKISIKILSVLMQKLGFQLYEIEFLTKRATAPFQHLSNLTRSYPISSSLLKTVLSNLVSLNPFVPNAPFLHLMFSGGRERVHWERMG